jgi:hypothetical protein
MTKAQLASALKDIHRKVRVNRDTLTKFMLDGSFNKLPVYPQSTIDSPYKRWKEGVKGYEISADDLGRVGEPSQSVANSIRLWVKQNLAEYGINPDAISVVYMEDEE